MHSLLYKPCGSGYPDDYLVARIHGRNGMGMPGVKEGDERGGLAQVDDNSIWNAAGKERQWLYQQMEEKMRRTMAPMLLYYEIDGVILRLRNIESGNDGTESEEISETSLLGEGLQNILQAAATPVQILTRLERFLVNSPLRFQGLAAAYREGGMQRCEERFRAQFFEQVLQFCTHPALNRFFGMAIDIRNAMIQAKALYWNNKNPQAVLDGGNVYLRKGDHSPSEGVLRKMVFRMTGKDQFTTAELNPVLLESLFEGEWSKIMARQMRSFSPVQCCSGYIYHCFRNSRMRSRTYHFSQFSENFPGNEEEIQ